MAFILLILAFAISDFSLQNVFTNSSTLMPLAFKISAAWSSHEGSMLLWLCLISSIGGFSIKRNHSKIYYAINLFLVCFVYFAANPFKKILINPAQGLGLNPILQDSALMIHPPILYLGYSFYIVPFIYCMTILMGSKSAKEYIEKCKIYSALGCVFLTLGIGLGSWWAYRELGWGGYWFFDPVENISLMPLIMGIAFHHSLYYSLKDKSMMKWTIFYGINIFPITVLGTFLVRSGILTSVHSFSSTNHAEVMLVFFLVLFTLSNLLFVRKSRLIEVFNSSNSSTIKGLKLSNILWFSSVIIILFSLVFPIIANFLGYQITVEIGYFKATLIPIIIPIIIVAAIFPYFDLRDLCLALTFSVISSCILYYIEKIENPLLCFIIFSSIFLIYAIIFKAIKRGTYNRMLLAHIAFGVLSLSVALNVALQKELDFCGKIGDSIEQDVAKIKLENIYFSEEDNYYKQLAEFRVELSGKVMILKPENRLYKIEQSLTSESYIISHLTEDIYVVLGKIDGDIIHAKIYIRPFMKLIWLSISIIAICFLRIGSKKKQV